MTAATHYAPPQRLSPQEARAQGAHLAGQGLLGRTLGAVGDAVAVLNAQRQVVYANGPLLELSDAGSVDELAGRRPGELLACVHAGDMKAGCGTGRECRGCGITQAILETQSAGTAAQRECTVRGRSRSREVFHHFRVLSTPFELEGQRYVLLALRDIAGEKQRAALERIFFHDVLNTVSSLKLHVQLLKGSDPRESGRLLSELEGIADGLAEEIQSQKMLVGAEAGTLRAQRNLIGAAELAGELARGFDRGETQRAVALAPESEDFALVSDAAILRRVLVNMLKNALEASPRGAVVLLGFAPDGDSGTFWVHNPGVVAEEARPHIFQRYFSTKGDDRGLGTYSMKLLSEEYLKGRVSFRSDAEHGTRFSVTLPLRPPG